MSEAAAARIVPPFALVGMISTGNEQKCPAAGGLAAYFCEGARDLGLRIAVAAIVRNPRDNVRLRHENVVTVVREPTTYALPDASGQNGEVPFSDSI